MKITLTPNLKLLFLQVVLTTLMAIPLKNASAGVIKVEQNVNTYLEKNDAPIDLFEELKITQDIKGGGKLLKVSLEAQGLSSNSSVTLVVNKKPIFKARLGDRFENIKLKLKQSTKVESVSIKAEAAFVSVAKADLVSDQPQVDDFSITVK